MRKISLGCLLLAIFWASPLLAAPQAKAVEWKIGDEVFSGFLVHEADGKATRPGLLMVPDWLGVTEDAVTLAKRMAGDDYVVLVVDMYGKGVRPQNPAEALLQVKKLYADRELMRVRMAKALNVLKAQADNAPLDVTRVGAFGFCFGGSSVLELARAGADIAGVVSFHGGLDTTLPAQAGVVKAPILVLNGADDKSVSPHIVGFEQEMNAAGADWQFVNFSGAVHCFALETANSPPGCVYNERAARRAHRMMDGFFDEVLAQD